MKNVVPVTIEKIARYWAHPRLTELSAGKLSSYEQQKELCKRLLPEAYDSGLCADSTRLYFEKGPERQCDHPTLRTATVRKLVAGNRWVQTPGALRPASAAFTKELIDNLNHDRPVQYLIPPKAPIGYRRNLLDKLCHLVKTSEPPLTGDSPLFTQIPLEPDIPGGPGAEAYARLRRVRDELLEDGSLGAVTYAALILVLAAWVQWRVEELTWLWDRAYIEGYLADMSKAHPEQGVEQHRPFCAESYLHRYHACLYRTTTRELYPIGTLTMEKQAGCAPTARMELRYSVGSDREKLDGLWNYTGRLMLSPHDRGAYALMGDERSGAVAYLTFAFTDFRSSDMYYRSALLVTFHPTKKVPQVQKIAIVRADLNEEQRALVLGTLSVWNEEIILTQAQLDRFCRENRDAPWMPQFLESILPFILRHETRCFCFQQNEIVDYSLGQLDGMDRLRIWMGLKAGAGREGGEFVRCTDPDELHKLLK